MQSKRKGRNLYVEVLPLLRWWVGISGNLKRIFKPEDALLLYGIVLFAVLLMLRYLRQLVLSPSPY